MCLRWVSRRVQAFVALEAVSGPSTGISDQLANSTSLLALVLELTVMASADDGVLAEALKEVLKASWAAALLPLLIPEHAVLLKPALDVAAPPPPQEHHTKDDHDHDWPIYRILIPETATAANTANCLDSALALWANCWRHLYSLRREGLVQVKHSRDDPQIAPLGGIASARVAVVNVEEVLPLDNIDEGVARVGARRMVALLCQRFGENVVLGRNEISDPHPRRLDHEPVGRRHLVHQVDVGSQGCAP